MAKTAFRAGRDNQAVQENIELLTGQRGNQLDRAVTLRDLASSGITQIKKSGTGTYTIQKFTQTSVSSGSSGNSSNQAIDTPTVPTGLEVSGAFSSISIKWDAPTYNGHSHTEIWRATGETFSDAVLIATTPATVFGDMVATGSQYYYWIRHINTADKAGPYNATLGTLGKTNDDISDIVDDLGTQLENSELIKTLNSNLSGTEQSLTQKINEQKSTLQEADQNLSDSLSDLSSSVEKNQSSVESLSKTVTDNESSTATRIDSLTSSIGTNKSSIESLSKTVTDNESSTATRIDSLTSSIGANKSSIESLSKTVTDNKSASSTKFTELESSIGDNKSSLETLSQTVATINDDGSQAFKSMWAEKATAGNITAGIGILAADDGTSQVAISASQVFVFDPNTEDSLTPLLAVNNGAVTIPKAFIQDAVVETLEAQDITADKVSAGAEISSPVITGGTIKGAEAGFGSGDFSGYATHIDTNGLIRTKTLYLKSGDSSTYLLIEDGLLQVVANGVLRVKLGIW
ncbi:phage tail tip fiber protein [Vibrio salinus]|uniref:phage tail tip fiber protein n=1 Tax=Vibrio salinus TaxID=2899784 RepID=UPI001E29EF2C|nr:DUF1983 domain-containing protein [Vibrio salinus]MCE0495779.1 DUF1983 domain-containing protein [Vibrio salinus]